MPGSSKICLMPRETFYQPRLPDIPPTYRAEQVAPPTSRMEQAVTQLATAYGVDLAQKGANLQLDLPDQPQRWLIGNIDGNRIGVTRCQVDAENGLAPDLDMVFEVTVDGWEPRELAHTDQVWQAYTQAMQARGEPVANEQGDFNFAAFTDFMAQDLAQHAATTLGG